MLFYKTQIVERTECSVLRNQTIVITKAYDGIPETIIIYSILFVIIVFLFSLIRYQHNSQTEETSRKTANELYSNFYNYHKSEVLHLDNLQEKSNRKTRIENGLGSTYVLPRGFFGWIKLVCTVSDEQILNKSGPDAIHYLSFQKHLMVIIGIATALSLLVILPVNFFMGDRYNEIEFGRTTLDNLTPSSNWLWVHVAVIIFYVPLITFTMQDCSGNNAFETAIADRTIIIKNIAKQDCNEDIIKNMLHLFYPDVVIEKVQLAYKYKKYLNTHKNYERVLSAKLYLSQGKDAGLKMKSKGCSCEKIDAYEYYSEEEARLADELEEIRSKLRQNTVGIAFVTVSNVDEVKHILQSYKSTKWSIAAAPQPDDIVWRNLRVVTPYWYLAWILLNSVLFIVLFFLATPVILVGLSVKAAFSVTKGGVHTLGFFARVLPVLLLCMLSALMPIIVALTDDILRYYTRSKNQYSVMVKTFLYLLLMILFLPTLGFQSLEALLQSMIRGESMHWHCIFRPNRGSFYVKYVFVESLLFNSLDLLRFFDLILYSFKLLCMKSRAEIPYTRRNMFRIFPFGKHYAWTTFFFTLSIVYSVFSPLIMPAAMVYICIKHFFDRYNLLFTYIPTNMVSYHGGKIHTVAIKMTICSIITLKLFMAMIFASVKDLPRATVILISLVISLVFFPVIVSFRDQARVVSTSTESPVYLPEELQNQRF